VARTDIYKTVANGVLEKGMPPWGKTLKPEQLLGRGGVRRTLAGHHTRQSEGPAGKPGFTVSP
jgi:cytochrome c oxidase cbb3-type subunit III